MDICLAWGSVENLHHILCKTEKKYYKDTLYKYKQ